MKIFRRYLMSLAVTIEAPGDPEVPGEILDEAIERAVRYSATSEPIAENVALSCPLNEAAGGEGEIDELDIDVTTHLLGPLSYSLDGLPVSLEGFLSENPDLDDREVREILDLQPGQSKFLGGGAFVLRKLACLPFSLLDSTGYCGCCAQPLSPGDPDWHRGCGSPGASEGL